MKIVEIIPQLSQGGAEKFVVDLANELSLKHDVTLIVLHEISGEKAFFYNNLCSSVKVISLNKKRGLDLLCYARLGKIIRKISPDVVHTHLRSILYIISLVIFNPKIKFIHTLHNDARKEADGVLGIAVRKLLFNIGVRPVTISENSKTSFNDLYHMRDEMIYNGVHKYKQTDSVYQAKEVINKIRKHPSSLILLNVARICEQKNQLMLVEAVANLQKNNHNIELIILGACLDIEIRNKIVSYGYDFIHLLESVPNPRDFMRLVDAFCLSSKYEGMPITLIECFSVGALPLCTPVGGVVDMIVDGDNGILTKDVSLSSIESAILRLESMPTDLRDKMREKSFLSFEQYSMQTCALHYENLMNIITSERDLYE